MKMNTRSWCRRVLAVVAGVLAFAGWGETALPTGYEPLAWIASTGREYIDTEYVHVSATKVTCEIEAPEVPLKTWAIVFGARYTNRSHNTFTFCMSNNTNLSGAQFERSGAWVSTEYRFPFNRRVRIEAQGRVLTWDDGTSTTTLTGEGTWVDDCGVCSFFIFNYNVGGPGAKTTDPAFGKFKLYSFTLAEGDVLKRDFVPCRRLVDGAAGLFDRVEGKFYGNAGTGAFVTPDTQRAAFLNYIDSTGAQRVVTDYATDADTTVFFDFANPVYANATAFFGLGWNGSCYLLNQQSDAFYFHGAGNKFDQIGKPDATTHYTFEVDDANLATVSNLKTGKSQSILVSRAVNNADTRMTVFDNVAGNRRTSFRFYGMEIGHGEGSLPRVVVPKRSLRPYRTAEGDIGLFDTLTETFYPNEGTAKFTDYGFSYNPIEGGFEVYEGVRNAGDTLFVAPTNVVKRGTGYFTFAATTGFTSLNVAEGSVAFANGTAETVAVAGQLALAGGTRLVLDVTGPACDSLQAGSVDLSGASAENPVVLQFARTANATLSETGTLTVIAGGLAAGDAAKFRAEGLPVTFSVVNGALVATIARTTAFVATWTGNGDRTNVNDPANWSCQDCTGAAITGVAPTTVTTVVLTSPTTFQCPAGQTLAYAALRFDGTTLELAADADWRGLGLAVVPAGFTIDLKGHALQLNWDRTPAVAFTLTNSGNAADLVVDVPAGTAVQNGSVTFTGALSLKKLGGGSFVWTTGKLAATIPITIFAGSFRNGYTANNTASKDIFGAGGTITVKNGGQFDLNYAAGGQSPFYARSFFVEGEGPDGEGAIVNMSTGTGSANHLNSVRATGDVTIGGSARIDVRGKGPLFDATGYTVTIKNRHMVAPCGGSGTIKADKIIISDKGVLQPCSDSSTGVQTGADGIELLRGGVLSPWNGSNTTPFQITPAVTVGEGGGEMQSYANVADFRGAVSTTSGTTLNFGKGSFWCNSVNNVAGATIVAGRDVFGATQTSANIMLRGTFTNAGTIEQVAGTISVGSGSDACALANNGVVRTTGGTFKTLASSSITGTGLFDFASTASISSSLASFSGAIRLSGGTLTLDQVSTLAGKIQLAGGTLNTDLFYFEGVIEILVPARGVLGIDSFNWPEKTEGKMMTVELGDRQPVVGEKLLSWTVAKKPDWTFNFTANGTATGVTPYVTDDGLYYGYSENSSYVMTAQWTGAAGNGDFTDPANWTCYNIAQNAVPNGRPNEFTVITLAADLDAVWTGFDAAAYFGTIDLNGHRFVLPGFDGTEATTCAVTDSSTGDRGELRFTIGAGTNYVHKTMSITGNLSVVKDGPGTLTWSGGTLAADIPLAITNGVFKLGINTANAFGASGTVTIANKGQLDTANMDVKAMLNRTFYVEGEGPDGRGAMLNSANTAINMKTMILTGDTTLGGIGRFDFRASNAGGSCSLHGEGYTLTIKNTSTVAFCGGNSSLFIKKVVVTDGGYFQPCGDCTGTFEIAEKIVLTNGGQLITWTGSGVYNVTVPVEVGEGGGVIGAINLGGQISQPVTVFAGNTLKIGGTKAMTIADLTVEEGATLTVPSGTFTVGTSLTNAGTVEQAAGTFTVGGNSSASTLANTGVFRVAGGTCNLAANAVANSGSIQVAGGTCAVSANSLANAGNFQVTGGTCTIPTQTAVTGNGTLDFAGGTVTVNADLTLFRGTLRSGGAVTANTINQFLGTLVFVDGSFSPNLLTANFEGEVRIDLSGRTGPFVIDDHNWSTYLAGRTITLDLAGRELTLGDKLLHWSTSPNVLTYLFDAETATAGISPYLTATGVFYGADPESHDAATATWTNESHDGVFLNPANWVCYNAAKYVIPNGVPRVDTVITLAADVPVEAWRDFNANSFQGAIDLAGHAGVLYGTMGQNATSFNIKNSKSGDPSRLVLWVDEGIDFTDKGITFTGNLSLLKDGPGRFTWGEGTLAAAIPLAVSNGVFRLGITTANAFGNGGTITVGGQGQFDLNIGAGGQSPVLSRTFYIAGDGPDGSGAIVNTSTTKNGGNHLKLVYLTDDATIGGTARIDFRGSNPNPTLDAGEHTLTIKNTQMVAFCGGAGTLKGKHVIISDNGVFQPCSDVNSTSTPGCFINVTDPIELKNGGIFASWARAGVTYAMNLEINVTEGSGLIRTDNYWYKHMKPVTVNTGAELILGKGDGWYSSIVNHGTVSAGSNGTASWRLVDPDTAQSVNGHVFNDGLINHTAGSLQIGSEQTWTNKRCCELTNDGTIQTSGGTFRIGPESIVKGTGSFSLLNGTPILAGSMADFTGEVVVHGGVPAFDAIETFPGTLRLVDGDMTNTPMASFHGKTVFDIKEREVLPFDITGKGWTALPSGTRVTIEAGDRRFQTGDKLVSWTDPAENRAGVKYKLASGQPGTLVSTDEGVVFMTGLVIILH